MLGLLAPAGCSHLDLSELFLFCITCNQCIRCGLLLHTNYGVVLFVVCWSLTFMSCAKYGSTDRDAICAADSGGPKQPCFRWGRDPHIGMGIFGGFLVHWKALGVGASALYAAENHQWHQLEYRASCSASDWSMSHCTLIKPPCYADFHQNSLTTCQLLACFYQLGVSLVLPECSTVNAQG